MEAKDNSSEEAYSSWASSRTVADFDGVKGSFLVEREGEQQYKKYN
jgi:hypothetical protein